jgi:hypothetical protein
MPYALSGNMSGKESYRGKILAAVISARVLTIEPQPGLLGNKD